VLGHWPAPQFWSGPRPTSTKPLGRRSSNPRRGGFEGFTFLTAICEPPSSLPSHGSGQTAGSPRCGGSNPERDSGPCHRREGRPHARRREEHEVRTAPPRSRHAARACATRRVLPLLVFLSLQLPQWLELESVPHRRARRIRTSGFDPGLSGDSSVAPRFPDSTGVGHHLAQARGRNGVDRRGARVVSHGGALATTGASVAASRIEPGWSSWHETFSWSGCLSFGTARARHRPAHG
jgi:hypothetical protein